MTDSLKLYETLKSGNLAEPQARAIAAAIGCALESQEACYEKRLATKVDEGKFDAEMHQIESVLTQRIADVGQKISDFKSSFELRIAGVESALSQKISDTDRALRAEMHTNYKASTRWTFAFWAGQLATTVGIVFAVIKMLK